jgi:flagellar motor protein MotB
MGNEMTKLYLKIERRLKSFDWKWYQTDRLNSTGFGETKPIDTNKTAAGKHTTEELKFL